MNALLDSNTGQNASAIPRLKELAFCANEPQKMLITKNFIRKTVLKYLQKHPKLPKKHVEKPKKTVAEPQRIGAGSVCRRQRLMGTETDPFLYPAQGHFGSGGALSVSHEKTDRMELTSGGASSNSICVTTQ
jgi:hypothetical protein